MRTERLYVNDPLAARRLILVELANTDGTPKTGAAGTYPQVSKNGGGFGNAAAALVNVVEARGLYSWQVAQTEFDYGVAHAYIAGLTGVLPWSCRFLVEAAPDLWYGTLAGGGTDYVQIAATGSPLNAPSKVDPGTLVALLSGTGAPAYGVVLSADLAASPRKLTMDQAWPVAPSTDTKAVVLQGPLPVPAVLADMIKVYGSALAAQKIAASADAIYSGKAVAGTLSSTQMSTDITEATASHFKNRSILFTSGVLDGQYVRITGYASGGLFTFEATPTGESPSADDTFVIV